MHGNVVITYTVDSEGDAIRSIDLHAAGEGKYVLIYGNQSGRIKKGDVVIK